MDRWKLTQARVETDTTASRMATVQKGPFSNAIGDCKQNRPYIVFLASALKIWTELASEPTFGCDEQGHPTRTIRFALACFKHLSKNIDPVVLDEMAKKIWLGEIRLKPSEIPKIVWDHDQHTEPFWSQKWTWKPVEKLLQTIAKQSEALRDSEYCENSSQVAINTISDLSHQIHTTVRGLPHDTYSREITQSDAPFLGTGKSKRQIQILWAVLKKARIDISMDGKGAWRDNVFVECLWCTIKYEEVYLHAHQNVLEARAAIGKYLIFYNSKRPHSSLDRQTPDQAYFNQLQPIPVAA